MTRFGPKRRAMAWHAPVLGVIGLSFFLGAAWAQIGSGDPSRDNRGQLLYQNESTRALRDSDARRNQDSLERSERARIDSQRRFDEVRPLDRSLVPGERASYRERRLERDDAARTEQNARDKVERTPPAPNPAPLPLP